MAQQYHPGFTYTVFVLNCSFLKNNNSVNRISSKLMPVVAITLPAKNTKRERVKFFASIFLFTFYIKHSIYYKPI